MEGLPKNPLLEFGLDTLEDVRKTYGLDKPGAMIEAVDKLDEWVKKQQHFVKKDLPRDYLERLIITTKGSVERAKERLDKICTFRTLMPQFFEDFELPDVLENIFTFAVLPKLTKDNYRVIVFKLVGQKLDPKLFLNGFKLLFAYTEYLRAHDYVNGVILIEDYMEVNIAALLPVLKPYDLHQGATILMQGYGIRIKGIYILSTSKLIDGVTTVFKQVISPKVGGRMSVYKSVETLHDVIDRDILPIEYGGKEKSFAELRDNWLKVLLTEEFKEYRREMNRARTDESLRRTDTFNEQYMGMPGTFRTLKDRLKVLFSKECKDYRQEMNRARTDESLRRPDTFNAQYMGMPGTFRTLSVD